jgi:multidrug efflux pump subunit AcrA (membrane-fusion protein)
MRRRRLRLSASRKRPIGKDGCYLSFVATNRTLSTGGFLTIRTPRARAGSETTAVRLLLVPLLLAATGCGGASAKKTDDAAAPEPPIVRPGSPKRRRMDRLLDVSGAAAALVRSEISSRLSNLAITSVSADVGDAVPLGAILCKLDDADLRRDLRDSEIAERESKVRVREAEAALREAEVQIPAQASVFARS